jgi:Transglycosylase SLT domain
MSTRTTSHSSRSRTSRLRPPSGLRRPGLYLAVAAAGAVLVGVVTGPEPAAQAEPIEAVSVAEQLGIPADAGAAPVVEQLAPLQQLAASRGERDADQAAAVAAQQAADREAARKAARKAAAEKAAAEKAAAEKAAAEKAAAEKAAAEEAAREQAAAEAAPAAEEAPEADAPAPAASPGGSFQDYALAQLGGDGGQFSCLESLWGKESGWNPDAQNPTSSAYGIAQFLDSTWAGTGIAKTSDGYRQIDAGLVYINSRYGSPCGAWQHSQANNWY